MFCNSFAIIQILGTVEIVRASLSWAVDHDGPLDVAGRRCWRTYSGNSVSPTNSGLDFESRFFPESDFFGEFCWILLARHEIAGFDNIFRKGASSTLTPPQACAGSLGDKCVFEKK